jgi:hypothetical protein
MTLSTGEFIRRFLIHVLPQGFHRIRHYGLFASGTRTFETCSPVVTTSVFRERPEVVGRRPK